MLSVLRSKYLPAILCAGLISATPMAALAQTTSAAPASIPSCQYTSDSTHSYSYCSTGQATAVTIPSGATVNYTFNYPGDSSNITFTAQLSGVPVGYASGVGFNVYDPLHPLGGTPVETATTQSNELNSNPNAIQFNYSSGNAGTVTVQLFNYAPSPVTMNFDDSGLVASSPNGNVTTAITLRLAGTSGTGAPAGPSSPTTLATPPPSSSPVASRPSGEPATIPSCQYTSDSTHPYSYCSTGQATAVTIPSGATVNYTLNYPGDNSNITVTALMSGVPVGYGSAVGFNIYDLLHPLIGTPVETATAQSNQLNSNPNAIQFNYSSGTAGTVTVQLFNYSPSPVTMNIDDSGLVATGPNGSTTSPVTLQLA